MPFGRHRGEPLEDVPSDYLDWLLRVCTLQPPLRRAVQDEVARRRQWGGRRRREEPCDGTGRPASDRAVVDWAGVIRTWHRQLVLRWHPDRGGTTESAQAIADAHELLKEMVGVD
jgi:hypothetical protein